MQTLGSTAAGLLHRRALVPALAVALWSVVVALAGGESPVGSATGVAHAVPATLIDDTLPAFHKIEQTALRKKRFFDYLTPLVRAENDRIRGQRQRLLGIAADWEAGGEPHWFDRSFLAELADEYRVPWDEDALSDGLQELRVRVDVIPMSLVLVQAAKESGWGSSRFARRANNLFGEWCYDPGCGLVPQRRAAGKVHEVESFETPRESIASYMRNLNSLDSYSRLRELRAELRDAERPLRGARLAEGLERYSERGAAYVREVQAMIRQNGLDDGAGSVVTGS